MHPSSTKLMIDYLVANNQKGFFECAITLGLLIWSMSMSWILFQENIWLGALFIPLLSLTLSRVFVLMHDCAHCSLFKNRKMNIIVGRVLGVIVVTPFFAWQWQHLIHHKTVGNLAEREIGGVVFSTLEEYRGFSLQKKIRYRLLHNPILFFFLFAQVYFFILIRFNRKNYRKHKQYKMKVARSIFLNNLFILLYVFFLYWLFNINFMLVIILPAYWLQQSMAAWIFFVQHIYPNANYWHEKKEVSGANVLSCTSFYKLPALLDWFTMNIGYHHIHHLYPRIPGYNLKRCYLKYNEFQKSITVLRLKDTIKLCRCVLYDEIQKRFVYWGAGSLR